MRIRGAWLLAIATTTLASCAGVQEKGAALGSRFVGQPFDSFVTHYGIPQASQKLSDGGMTYEWTSRYGVANTGAAVQTLLMAGSGAEVQGGSYQLGCTVRLVVGRTGGIEQFIIANDTIGAWQMSRCNEVFAEL